MVAAVLAILAAAALWALCAPDIVKRKAVPGVRGYRLFYSDQKAAEHKDGVTYGKLLVSDSRGLCGKPDYVFVKGNDLCPVELKSGAIGDADEPRLGDLMQLTAYFLILEDAYGVRPKRGRLVYSDYMFIVRNTAGLRRRLERVIADMRDMLKTGEQEVSPSFIKCKSCVCRGTVCEYAESEGRRCR